MNLVKREVYHVAATESRLSPPSPTPPPNNDDDLTRLRQLAEIAASRDRLLKISTLFYHQHPAIAAAAAVSSPFYVTSSNATAADARTSASKSAAATAALLSAASLLSPPASSPYSHVSSPTPSPSPPPPQESPIDLRVVKCRRLDWAMERRDSLESNRFVFYFIGFLCLYSFIIMFDFCKIVRPSLN
jgi:hypothetical protein